MLCVVCCAAAAEVKKKKERQKRLKEAGEHDLCPVCVACLGFQYLCLNYKLSLLALN